MKPSFIFRPTQLSYNFQRQKRKKKKMFSALQNRRRQTSERRAKSGVQMKRMTLAGESVESIASHFADF
jgi:hypothetical protein